VNEKIVKTEKIVKKIGAEIVSYEHGVFVIRTSNDDMQYTLDLNMASLTTRGRKLFKNGVICKYEYIIKQG